MWEEIPRVESNPEIVDSISLVKILHGLSGVQLSQLISESKHATTQVAGKNSSSWVAAEDLSRIPGHLLASLIQSGLDENFFKYVLSGFSLLYKLYGITPWHPRLRQVLLDDIILVKQLFELIIYILLVLNVYTEENQISTPIILLHSTIVASCLNILTKCISPDWSELAKILAVHPKVDIFMDAAFAAARVDIHFLQIMLSSQYFDPCAEEVIKHHCQQCEASVQFIQTLCQQEPFQDCPAKHKILCGHGGILLLAQLVLKLNISTSLDDLNYVVAAVSRLKSKVLSLLFCLCEKESISYLDEVANSRRSFHFAKFVAIEVLELLQTTLFSGHGIEPSSCLDENMPKGLLHLTAMRLTDILSDDTNFQSYITTYIAEVFTTIFLHPHQVFISSWCASDVLCEEDATLEYDPSVAAEWVLDSLKTSHKLVTMRSKPIYSPCNMPRNSYAHQRTALLAKVIANLHCFVPDICKDEKDLFLQSSYNFLQKQIVKLPDGSSWSSPSEKVATIRSNLRSLLNHAESLILCFLTVEDVQLLRVFVTQLDNQLDNLIRATNIEMNQVQETQNAEGLPSFLPSKHAARGLKVIDRNVQNVEPSGSASGSVRAKNSTDQIKNAEHIKEPGFAGVQEDERGTIQCAESQQKKRKRNIMNDKQISLIENAILDKPDMHRDLQLLQYWAEQLSGHGSNITASQLKNWLNNRKARLAHVAKVVQGPCDGDNSDTTKQGGSVSSPFNVLPENRAEDNYIPLAPKADCVDASRASIEKTGIKESSDSTVPEVVNNIPEGQYVLLVNEHDVEIGKGKVHQVKDIWFGINLEDLGTYVVDIVELICDRRTPVPYPCQATGNSFYQAKKKLGVTRVLWDSRKLLNIAE